MARKTRKVGTPAGARAKGTPARRTYSREELRSFREKAGLTRARLAQLLDVSIASIHNWESGRSVPRSRSEQKLVVLMNGEILPPSRAASRPSAAAGATATTEILKGYLATSQGAKLSPSELVTLTGSLRRALG